MGPSRLKKKFKLQKNSAPATPFFVTGGGFDVEEEGTNEVIEENEKRKMGVQSKRRWEPHAGKINRLCKTLGRIIQYIIATAKKEMEVGNWKPGGKRTETEEATEKGRNWEKNATRY